MLLGILVLTLIIFLSPLHSRRALRYRHGWHPMTGCHCRDYRRNRAANFLLLIIAILLLILVLRHNAVSLKFPALMSLIGSPPTDIPDKEPENQATYLEFGAYPDHTVAQDAKRRISFELNLNLKVVQCADVDTPFCLVIGPFRNRKAAEGYKSEHRLKGTRVVQYQEH